MITEEIKKFIQDNNLVRIQASPITEFFDLWECTGGHVLRFEMINQAIN